MARPHWDDVLVQVSTFVGVFVALYQKATQKHQNIEQLIQSGWLVGACVASFGIVGTLELRGKGVPPEAHRAGKRKNLFRRVITAVSFGYGLPNMISALG